MMKNQIRNAILIAAAAVLIILAFSSGEGNTKTIRIYDAFDTYSEISASGKNAEKALEECREKLSEYHSLWNAEAPESEISRLNASAGLEAVNLCADTIDILKRAKLYNAETNGFFDVTVGAPAKLWSIPDAPRVPSKEELAEVIHKIGFDVMDVGEDSAYLKKKGASVTLGAIAKGYATEKLVDILKKDKIRSALLNLGGNVYALGTAPEGKPWSIGIADPQNDGELIGKIAVSNKAVITSAGNYRFFEEDGIRYSHIINPYTASPANSGLLSVSIVSANPTEADVLSTACYVIGYANSLPLLKEYNADAIFVTDNGCVYYTDGLDGVFEYDNKSYEYKTLSLSINEDK